MNRSIAASVAALIIGLSFQGCSCSDDTPFFFDGITYDTLGDWGGGDTAGDTSLTDIPIAGFGTVQGRVMSPQSPVGSFPISGALVYVTKVEPSPIDEGVYCNVCVEMPSTRSRTPSATPTAPS